MQRARTLMAGLVLWAQAASAQQVTESKITYPSPPMGGSIVQIPAALRVPSGRGERVPAVVVVHSSGGVEDSNRGYIAALNAAGIATLEVDYFTPRGVATLTRPGTTPKPSWGQTIPDSLSALSFLSRQPAIDPTRIGIMGFSYGGAQALLTASLRAGWLAQSPIRFAAHAALYPGCSAFAPGGPAASFLAGPLDGSPVLVLAGTADDFDEPDSCEKFIVSLAAADRPRFSLTMYPNATHGWDKPSAPRTTRDPDAHLGKGGSVTITANSAVTEQSIATTVAFFRRAFRF
ncbi:MAG: hypothetical protein EXQ88_01150 [Alphaproteobacteria bacterium]|nr:hypothetical protein [Alphaproteobacteria bacterium]